MNHYFETFIAESRRLAEAAGLRWDPPISPEGSVLTGHAWDLTAVVHGRPPRAILANLGRDLRTLEVIAAERSLSIILPRSRLPLTRGWTDLFQAVAADHVLVRRNQPRGVLAQVVRPLRVLATCVPPGVEPWDIEREDVEQALRISALVQECGKLRDLVLGVVRDVIDASHLADRCPIAPPAERRKLARHPGEHPSRPLRSSLEERTDGHKLPEAAALWELVRIVFCERPRTFSDVLRFAQVKLLLTCAFRIGEVEMLPHDWRREREYYDLHGRPAGEFGGLSRALCIRYFAEKKRSEGEHNNSLMEATHYVPAAFEALVDESLSTVERITAPLRARLKSQTETGRVFPEYEPSALMPAEEFFVRLFGSLHVKGAALPEALEMEYRRTWSSESLDALRVHQERSAEPFRSATKSARAKLHDRAPLPPLRTTRGFEAPRTKRQYWRSGFFRVGELEEYVRNAVPTKLPDTNPMRMEDGTLVFPHQFLFLAPKRALLEEREDSLLDVGLYFAVGRVDVHDLAMNLGSREEANLFQRYGRTAEDRALSLNSHSLRHLYTSELLRLGLSELIVTLLQERGGVVETRQYKHLSLAQDLAQMELPKGAERVLGPNAQDALKAIRTGRLTGPFVERFKRVQRDRGEEAALQLLAAEADGFQATLYGYCMTSLLVNPCPKGMECFDGCKHLVLSANDEHRTNLLKLRTRYSVLLDELAKLPPGHVGRDNQEISAKTKLMNVDRALAALPGQCPFPDGEDRFKPFPSSRGLL